MCDVCTVCVVYVVCVCALYVWYVMCVLGVCVCVVPSLDYSNMNTTYHIPVRLPNALSVNTDGVTV
jgi:hypothetical protein